MTNILEEATKKTPMPTGGPSSPPTNLGAAKVRPMPNSETPSQQATSASHGCGDTQMVPAGAGSTVSGGDHNGLDAQPPHVAARQSTGTSHSAPDAHSKFAGAGPTVEGAAKALSMPNRPSPSPSAPDSGGDQTVSDAQSKPVAARQPSGTSQAALDAHRRSAGAGLIDPQRTPIPAMEAHMLSFAADVLDDLEATRIANANRLDHLTRAEPDKDGELRGLGRDVRDKDVARQADLVTALEAVEHKAILNLQRLMRQHPLEPWRAAQHGVGEKQFARLLAAVGDPYWNTLYGRPRTESELVAFCGFHNVGPVAARRQRGQRANWSTTAKTRAYLIAVRMLVKGNRELYDARKAATEGRVHVEPCVRCGPSGHPAQPGSPWSAAHRHADALRIVSKWLLREMWAASRDVHLASQDNADAHRRSAGGVDS